MGNKGNRKLADKRKAQKPVHDSPKRNKISQESFLEETKIKQEFEETNIIIKEGFIHFVSCQKFLWFETLKAKEPDTIELIDNFVEGLQLPGTFREVDLDP